MCSSSSSLFTGAGAGAEYKRSVGGEAAKPIKIFYIKESKNLQAQIDKLKTDRLIGTEFAGADIIISFSDKWDCMGDGQGCGIDQCDPAEVISILAHLRNDCYSSVVGVELSAGWSNMYNFTYDQRCIVLSVLPDRIRYLGLSCGIVQSRPDVYFTLKEVKNIFEKISRDVQHFELSNTFGRGECVFAYGNSTEILDVFKSIPSNLISLKLNNNSLMGISRYFNINNLSHDFDRGNPSGYFYRSNPYALLQKILKGLPRSLKKLSIDNIDLDLREMYRQGVRLDLRSLSGLTELSIKDSNIHSMPIDAWIQMLEPLSSLKLLDISQQFLMGEKTDQTISYSDLRKLEAAFPNLTDIIVFTRGERKNLSEYLTRIKEEKEKKICPYLRDSFSSNSITGFPHTEEIQNIIGSYYNSFFSSKTKAEKTSSVTSVSRTCGKLTSYVRSRLLSCSIL